MMDTATFYKIYLPALEISLENDNVNHGYSVFEPDYYIENQYQVDVDDYINSSKEDIDFFEMIAYYFDAKSHNFPNIEGVEIDIYKENIIKRLNALKSLYFIPLL